MRVLKIGRTSANDVKLNDLTVSSQHATITISDTGEVRLKDLNSKNGTYVNGQRIFTETLIAAKDIIKAGNSVVDWQKHLKAPKPVRQFPVIDVDAASIKQKKNIGRNSGNDIVLAYNEVSGSHAQLIQKSNGDIVIADSGSTNGTYVNGHKISMQILKPGDMVLLANKYPLDWSNIFPKAIPDQPATKNTKTKILLVAAAVLVVVIGSFLFIQKPWGTQSPEKIYAMYKKSVVLIVGAYYYEASAGGRILGYYSQDEEGDIVEIKSQDDAIVYTGTGFIVSNDGKIITNKHIAAPWDYDGEIISTIKNRLQRRIGSEVNVTGNMVFIGCFLNDTHISSLQDLIQCTVVRTGASNDIDVAVLQINGKTLPNGVKRIVDLNQAVITDDMLVVGTSVFTIGFPAGFGLGMTEQGIQANNQDGKITQIRDDFVFGHNITIIGGASGSPVFNQYGKLVGVINAGYLQGYNLAIKAKYAVELVK